MLSELALLLPFALLAMVIIVARRRRRRGQTMQPIATKQRLALQGVVLAFSVIFLVVAWGVGLSGGIVFLGAFLGVFLIVLAFLRRPEL